MTLRSTRFLTSTLPATALLIVGLAVASFPTGIIAGNVLSLTDDPTEIIPPDIAFQPEVISTTDDQVTIAFEIKPGYYLYRDKINVVSNTPGVAIDAVNTEPGIIVTDDFFGKTETYRERTEITAQIQPAPDTRRFDLTVQSQGCADLGICFPPQEQVLTINLPATAMSAAAPVNNALNSLLGTGDEEALLPPEIAFVPSLDAQQGDSIAVRFSIEDGYYLYKDKFDARLIDAGGAQITAMSLPSGKLKEDEFFGTVEVFRNSTQATLSLATINSTTDAILKLGYQGCADIGVCYPPQTTSLPVTLIPTTDQAIAPLTTTAPPANAEAAPAALVASTTATTAPSRAQIQTELAEQDRLALALSNKSLWVIALTFFGLGLLLAFTPCVFPMIPILSSLIVGQGKSITTRKAFSLSAIYVLAMALTYTIAGVAVGLSGENIQIWFQNPWVLSAFAAVFILLSLSMFGFYELQMPASVQQRLSNLSNRQQGGTYIGAGIMGFLSALIVGPCVTAPLVGALIFIADTGNAVVGGIALFCLSMGMGAPLLIIGTSAGKWLPKNGAWMDTTKAIFGILLLALAIWMVSRFVPAGVTMALSAALAIVGGIYLGAGDSMPENSSGWRKLFKGVGLIALLYGASLLIGALGGGHSLLQPLSGFVASSGSGSNSETSSTEISFERIKGLDDLNQVIANASADNRPVMLDFYADWCISCKEMEAFTFSDAQVQGRLEDVVLVQADVTLNDKEDKALLKHFGLFGPPAIIFYNPGGQEIRNARVVGYMPADDFSAHLDLHL